MEEIKSVRLRRKSATPDENLGLGDIKIILYKDVDRRSLASIQSNGSQLWPSTDYSGTRYVDYTSDQLIQDYIKVNSIFQDKPVDYYQIIQDPWLETPPKWRSFGYDCYYLNNGSSLFINWTLNGSEVGGKSWSDDDGNELDIERGSTQSNKSSIIKRVTVISPDNQKMCLSTSGFTYKLDDFKDFNGAMNDLSIVSDVISTWKIKVPNYELDLCSPNYISCNLQKYINPIDELPKEEFKSATQSNPKFKLNVVLDNLKTKVKEDISNLKIYLGDIPSEFVYQDEIEFLDSEYIEGAFSGEEEKIIQLNQIDDEPVGDTFDEVDKSTIGSGPIKGSKLTNKAGTQMINLAGYRLNLIVNDLTNYLNKNGYPGAKIKSNGVMRDLRGSAYPSSPARATASLHGAGLAIDLIFNIPGFKWNGIGDNANLSSDAKLTKVINNFVKGQGDITWGAYWGKGSNPGSGVVSGRGITEYHHMEIRADLIPKYWEPVKDELSKYGFKPSQLTSPGKGSGLHRLMLRLLGD
jgi:hypothetical protein